MVEVKINGIHAFLILNRKIIILFSKMMSRIKMIMNKAQKKYRLKLIIQNMISIHLNQKKIKILKIVNRATLHTCN